ncbi:hypothetical protein TIFTF001_001953 [Ficus carica]|uniref:Uncharacterized protein n=1 Tax=Ficus carica TaxID=3494 RepID=A0AA87Z2A3_FICCA|nr:hypothetical protein TIFTF001_001953 [Ficus carica]
MTSLSRAIEFRWRRKAHRNLISSHCDLRLRESLSFPMMMNLEAAATSLVASLPSLASRSILVAVAAGSPASPWCFLRPLSRSLSYLMMADFIISQSRISLLIHSHAYDLSSSKKKALAMPEFCQLGVATELYR